MNRYEAAIHALLILLAGAVLAAAVYCLAALPGSRRPVAVPVRPQYLQPIPLYRLPNYQSRHAS